jgi:L-rhamnose-H+ transport protein
METFLGLLLILTGGLASGSFYYPFTRVRSWAWEVFWLAGGIFSWLLAPWVAALITQPDLLGVYREAGTADLLWPVFFGLLWGVGGLTFGLALRYLGMSLGMAIALGLTAAFGTLVPPIFRGEIGEFFSTRPGLVTLTGVLLTLVGIAVTGKAGMMKDSFLPEKKKKEIIRDFDFKKGLLVALFAGLMSACFAFGIAAGKPVAELAVAGGASALTRNNPVFVLILIGGFITNAAWCLYLGLRNKSFRDITRTKGGLRAKNFFYTAAGGIIWYLQFFFYGMGESKMGRHGFAAWSILMSSTIIFSNLFGLLNKEWMGTGKRTAGVLILGLLVLILSTVIIGYGTYLQATGR